MIPPNNLEHLEAEQSYAMLREMCAMSNGDLRTMKAPVFGEWENGQMPWQIRFKLRGSHLPFVLDGVFVRAKISSPDDSFLSPPEFPGS